MDGVPGAVATTAEHPVVDPVGGAITADPAGVTAQDGVGDTAAATTIVSPSVAASLAPGALAVLGR